MTSHFKRSLRDMADNGLLSVVTVITVSLSVLIIGSFMMLFVNAERLMNTWKQGVKVMVYMKRNVSPADLMAVKSSLNNLTEIDEISFISKEDAMKTLKERMSGGTSLLDGLGENPLPDAFEVRVKPEWSVSPGKVEALAKIMENLPAVEDVQYAKKWVDKFSGIVSAFKIAGFALGALFFVAATFFVGNTIRLVLFSKRQEIDIMRLVGAEDSFIKIPFYLEAIIYGALGGATGLAILYGSHLLLASNMRSELLLETFHIAFLPADVCLYTVAGCIVVGWLGCFTSLKQFLKN